MNLLEFKARNTIQEILAELESNGYLGKDGVPQKKSIIPNVSQEIHRQIQDNEFLPQENHNWQHWKN